MGELSASGCWPAGTPLLSVGLPRAQIVFPDGDRARRARAAGFLPGSTLPARAARRARILQAWSGIWLSRNLATGGTACDYLEQAEDDELSGVRECARISAPDKDMSMIVRHVDKEGAPVAYSKFALGPRSVRGVEAEVSMLKHLDGRHAPKLLLSRVGEELVAFTATALSGQVLRYRDSVPADLESCLPQTGRVGCLEEHPWVVDLSTHSGAVVERALALVDQDLEWPTVVMHGDAAPWNAIRTPEGQLSLYDWEFGSLEGLWLFDRAHWTLQVSRLSLKQSSALAAKRSVRDLMATQGLTYRTAAALVSLVAVSLERRMRFDRRPARIEPAEARDVAWWRECAAQALSIGRGGAAG